MVGYPHRFLAILWTVLVALTVSGLLLVPGAFELRWEMDVPVQLPDGFRIGVAAAHALCAFLVLVLLGALYSLHMRLGWRRKENVRSGLTSVSVLVALALTGLGIYYLADEQLSRWTSGLHIAFSVVSVAAVVTHTILGRRARAARLARIHHHTSPMVETLEPSRGKARTPASTRPPAEKIARRHR